YVLQKLERQITGATTLGSRSYPARLDVEDDYSVTQFWHTLYTWIASDVTFPGTLVVMMLIGRLFALIWIDTLRGDNPYAVGMFLTLVTLLYYVPTGNIVLGQPEAFAAFWGLLLMWLATRRRAPARARGPRRLPLLPAPQSPLIAPVPSEA
ncbi:MAG: hypothetical protein H0W68_10105, partial [Gemmatimonadaceae bacterium]|nr:hypothetical protein [Gemmatimonadaceae bacterium]